MNRCLCWPVVLLFLACEPDPGPRVEAVSSPLQEEAAPAVEAPASPTLGPMSEAEFRDLVRRTLDLLDRRDVDGARDLCVQALDARPGDPQVTHLLAVVEMVAQNFESVVDLAGHQLARDPDALPFLATRAEAAFYLQDVDQSQRDLLRIIERLESAMRSGRNEGWCGCATSPDEAVALARLDLARTYYVLGDLDEAEAIVRDVLAQDPDSIEARFVLALVLNKRDDLAGAMGLYEQILEEEPWCAACQNNLGVLAYRQHDLKRCRERLQAALRLTPDRDLWSTALVLSNLAELDLLKGRLREAEAGYREAIATAWRYPGAYYGLATVQDIRGEVAEAKATLTQALLWDSQGFDRHNAEYYEPEWRWYLEGLVLEHQGQAKQARAMFEKVATGKVRMLRGPAKRHL